MKTTYKIVYALAITLMVGAGSLSIAARAASTLPSGGSMSPNSHLTSPNGQYNFIFACSFGSCSLILSWTGQGITWSQNVGNAVTLEMQAVDGNLVTYDGSSTPTWDTNTDYNPGAWLNIQDDGNAVVYSASNAPLWSAW